MAQSRHIFSTAQKGAATQSRDFRTFLLMQEFAKREIGTRIALARKEHGAMTQEELADLLNVSKRSIQDYEAGLTIPWKHFKRLEDIFERPLSWFLHGTEDSGPATPDDVQSLRDELASFRAWAEGAMERIEATQRRLEDRLAAIADQLREPR